MNLDTLKQRIPDHAKDIKLNLGSVLRSTELSERQLWGTALASAIATRNPQVISAIEAEAGAVLSPDEARAARGAATIMAMNNVYYRFLYMVGDDDYRKLPARLRMQIIGSPGVGVDRADFELWCLAVSAINGCQDCVRSHERVLRKADVAPAAIQGAVRVAAVLQATAVALESDSESAAELAA